MVARQLYHPYGTTRYSEGTLATDFGFTGQRKDSYTQLVFMHARYYHPALGRFVSADTIVPDPGNPQAHNRYAYVAGNPLKHIDPSGHGWFTDQLIALGQRSEVAKGMLVSVAEAAQSISDPGRSPSMEAVRQNIGGGLKSWGDVARSAGAVVDYTGSAIAEGRGGDAARGAGGLARMSATMATVPFRAQWELAKGIVTSPIRACQNAWEFGTAAREYAAGERSGWDVAYHGLVLTGDLISLGGALNSRLNSEVAQVTRTGQQWQGRFPTQSSSEFLYRPDAGQTIGHFARYDSAGSAMYRVDIVGAADVGVPTPHLQAAKWNMNPATGITHFNGWANAVAYSLGHWPIFAYSPVFLPVSERSD